MRIERVTVQLRRPVGTDPGQVTEGFYTVRDGVLTMVRADGGALIDKNGNPVGKPYSLKNGDSADAIARVLTKQVRRQMLGMTEKEETFSRKLNYKQNGVA
jgi:hypothetical protein